MTDPIRKLNDALTDILSEMPRPPGKEDWVYRDLDPMREDFFGQFLEIVGSENIQWLTFASYEHDDGTYKRGQAFVSPEGMERLRAYLKGKKDA